MLIDWFTVSAQAINFLILVWLLKRFLYRPVLAAIDAREKRIAQQLESAAKQQAEARAERDDFQRRSNALDQEREKILHAASVRWIYRPQRAPAERPDRRKRLKT